MACAAAIGVIASNGAEAQTGGARALDISARNLPAAIAELSREAGVSIGTDGVLPRVRTRHVRGSSVGEVLARLLDGSGYRARRVGETAWRIERVPGLAGPSVPAWTRPGPSTAPETAPVVPIVVTGVKQERALFDVPMAISAVTVESHSSADPSSSTALVAGETEGLALTALGPGRNRMFVRGVADSAFNGESQSTVAVILDDARVTYAAPDPDIRLVDVERVEVLKGPQGSLYGIGALGGIYHIVTHKPDLGETSFSLSSGLTATRKGAVGLSASGVANLPFAQGAAALRLVGYTTREPGWIESGERANVNSSRVTGARAGIGFEPGRDWRIDLGGFAQWLESRDSRYVYEPRALERPEQQSEPHDNDLRMVSARIARDTDNVDLVLSSGMSWHEVVDAIDATQGAGSFGMADPLLLEDQREFRVWDSEARISGKWGNYTWLLGLSHVMAKQSVVWNLEGVSGDTLVIDDDRRTTYDTALFVNLSLPLADRLTLEGGARLFRSVTRETRQIGGEAVTRQRERNGMTPSLALSWRPDGRQQVFLRYGSAFRQGGSDIGPDGKLEALNGDELASVEAGWRREFGSGGRFELGMWYSWWENLQSDLLEENGLIETANAGDARIYGAEASMEFEPARDWRIEAGASFTMAKLTSTTLGFEVDDRHLPAVPEYTLRARVRRDFRIGTIDGWVRMNFRYVGPSHLSFDPDLDRDMGNYVESGAEVHARLDRLELALVADNLLGGKADMFAFGNSLRLREAEQFTPQRPLTVSAQAVLRF